jgi:hypothetical protein
MRIKIIGENNCARATRHLLRMAGFAVTEFLPAEAITHAPHFGYAITIECPSSVQAPNPGGLPFLPQDKQVIPAPDGARSRVPASGFTPDPASMPEHSTHGQPATRVEEASSAKDGASSPAFGREPSSIGISLCRVGFDSANQKLTG